MPFYRLALLPISVVLSACALVAFAAITPLADGRPDGIDPKLLDARLAVNIEQTVERVNHLFEVSWSEQGLIPVEPAETLTVMRRLSLALVGTIPSLDEIRQFEADTAPDRLRRWTTRLMADRRFNDYFAERLTVAFVGDRESKEPHFSRTRLESWIAEQLAKGTAYDDLVRQLITEDGPPTSNRAANFVTAEMVADEPYANRLAARSARAFLGQRIDCAECHDHPFDQWTQSDFQGLAAWFSEVRRVPTGIADDADREFQVEDRETLAKKTIEPRVPFHDEWLGEYTARRREFADWITHSRNDRFWRAIANRVWGLMFGRPYIQPVDAIPNPVEPDRETPETDGRATIAEAAEKLPSRDCDTELLDLLANDLREHGGDLRRLVLVIASSKPFLLASSHSQSPTTKQSTALRDGWAIFPLVQLRPEQFARSLMQATSLQTLDSDPNTVTRVYRLKWLYQYLDQNGRLGETELDERTESISQTMRRMQGRFVRDSSRPKWSTAAGNIAILSSDAKASLDASFLVCLTRRPNAAEENHFLPELKGRGINPRKRVVEDIFWSLFNSPEFGWNH